MGAVSKLARFGCILIAMVLQWDPAIAQSKFLSRKVSIDITSCSLEVALIKIGKAANFRFSYDAAMIPGKRMVRLKANGTPVNTLLKEVLGKGVSPREIGNHVILVRNHADTREKQPFADFVVSGYILSASSHKPITNATVYEIEQKKSTLTGGNGYYKIVIPSGRKVIGITFCKSGYADTVIFIRQTSEQRIDVFLK